MRVHAGAPNDSYFLGCAFLAGFFAFAAGFVFAGLPFSSPRGLRLAFAGLRPGFLAATFFALGRGLGLWASTFAGLAWPCALAGFAAFGHLRRSLPVPALPGALAAPALFFDADRRLRPAPRQPRRPRRRPAFPPAGVRGDAACSAAAEEIRLLFLGSLRRRRRVPSPPRRRRPTLRRCPTGNRCGPC